MILTFVKIIDIPNIRTELSDAGFGDILSSISYVGNVLTLTFSKILSLKQNSEVYRIVLNHNPRDNIAENSINDRMMWGKSVITKFRLYTLGIPDDQGLPLLSNMMDIKQTLELGMLAVSAYLLSTKPSDTLLDTDFGDGRTVRQRFIDMITKEGPVP